jgi:hypothetical protein
MLIVPLQAVPSQRVATTLGGQNCLIAVYQKMFGLFLDLSVGATPIVTATICLNQVRIVRSLYLGFVGDLCFIDNQGGNDPDYTGLGGRYSLAYLEAGDDLPAGVG